MVSLAVEGEGDGPFGQEGGAPGSYRSGAAQLLHCVEQSGGRDTVEGTMDVYLIDLI
jgi:hypothetical protein